MCMSQLQTGVLTGPTPIKRPPAGVKARTLEGDAALSMQRAFLDPIRDAAGLMARQVSGIFHPKAAMACAQLQLTQVWHACWGRLSAICSSGPP